VQIIISKKHQEHGIVHKKIKIKYTVLYTVLAHTPQKQSKEMALFFN
jgi:hypothetical protein